MNGRLITIHAPDELVAVHGAHFKFETETWLKAQVVDYDSNNAVYTLKVGNHAVPEGYEKVSAVHKRYVRLG
jgi:hypothetical protein